MPRALASVTWLLGAVLSAAVVPAHGQSNIDAGKSAAQLFAASCNACHRSPREIKRTSAGFLREHYTAGPREAAALAAYLDSVGNDPRLIEQRKRPQMGAGQEPKQTDKSETQHAALREGEQGKPSRPRRPSESLEAGASIAAAPAAEQSAAAAGSFEE